ncbi:MAG: hypothetical protein EOP34_05650, partial [Rickettsiales bacterium]
MLHLLLLSFFYLGTIYVLISIHYNNLKLLNHSEKIFYVLNAIITIFIFIRNGFNKIILSLKKINTVEIPFLGRLNDEVINKCNMYANIIVNN